MKNKTISKGFLGLFFLFVVFSMQACKVMSTQSHQHMINAQDSLRQGWLNSQVTVENMERSLSTYEADTTALRHRLQITDAELEAKNNQVMYMQQGMQRLQEALSVIKSENSEKRISSELIALADRSRFHLGSFSDVRQVIDSTKQEIVFQIPQNQLFEKESLSNNGKKIMQAVAKILNENNAVYIFAKVPPSPEEDDEKNDVAFWEDRLKKLLVVVDYFQQKEFIAPNRINIVAFGTPLSEQPGLSLNPESANNDPFQIVLQVKKQQDDQKLQITELN